MFQRDIRQVQSNTIALITFWSQFAAYTLNTVLILYLTRPILQYGIGYSESKAYNFIGVTTAVGYLMPMLGGFMADNVIGLCRSILIGTLLLATACLLVMISGFTVIHSRDYWFIAAFALLPATGSLLMGTSSALVSRIFREDEIRSKSGMTLYYMSINAGALLATLIAPALMTLRSGPLVIFGLVFAGKLFAALNYWWRYALFDNVVTSLDSQPMRWRQVGYIALYVLILYVMTFSVYRHAHTAGTWLAVTSIGGITWFLVLTLRLESGARSRQLIAILLIVEAISFFVLYNQMNTTLILCAKNNSDLHLLGMSVSPANYQMINPLVIIVMSLLLPSFYRRFQRFNIPFQFAAGTLLAGVALLVMWFACLEAHAGIINGNYIGLTYFLLTISELWVSAIGLSMIGLYCEMKMIALAMGVWYLSCSLSGIISGRLAGFVALPGKKLLPTESLVIYQHYYFWLGVIAIVLGTGMFVTAKILMQLADRHQIRIV